MKINDVMKDVFEEYRFASHKHRPFNSPHEGFAVLLEEVDELWEAIKTLKNFDDRNEAMKKEAIQVVAMGIRFLVDVVE